MKHKIVHLFYHDDVDGIVSAAMIMNAFFRGHVYRLYPAKSSMRGDKFNALIEDVYKTRITDNESLVIVDYQHHEKADLWVDHHFSQDLKDNEVHNGKIFYNPNVKSAARVIYNWFQNTPFLKGAVDQHVVDMVDMIDSAGYKTIDYIFSSTEPLMILKAYLEHLSIFVDSTYNRLVELINLYNFDINKVLFTLGVDCHVVDELKNSAHAIERNMIINGAMGVTEMNRLYAYPRYSEYLIKPDLMYSVRIVHLGGNRVHADVGFNKWQKESCKVHIGKVLQALDYPISGGGHPTVGGAIFLEKEVERFIDDMCVQLNGPEDSMEKYGVDSEDGVEKKADELIKTGEAKTKDEAREKVTSEEEGGSTEDVQS